MAQGTAVRPPDSGGPDQGFLEIQDVGAPHRIGLMMHSRSVEMMRVIRGVEDVALDQEMLDGAGTGVRDDPFHRAVAHAQVRRFGGPGIVALREEIDFRHRLLRIEEFDLRVKIRKFERCTRGGHGNRATYVRTLTS